MHLSFQNKKREKKKPQQLLFPVSFSLSISLQWLRCKNLIFFIFLGVFSVDSILFLSWNAFIFVWMLLFWNLTIAGWMPKSELHAQLGAGPQASKALLRQNNNNNNWFVCSVCIHSNWAADWERASYFNTVAVQQALCLYLLPVAPPVPLLGKDPSVVVEIDLLPQRDLLKLRPLKGAVRQLPSLLLRTARRHTSVKAALQEPT